MLQEWRPSNIEPLLFMHDIDLRVLFFLREGADRWPKLDAFFDLLASNEVLKAGPVLVAIWALWFVRDAKTDDRRIGIVSLLIAGCSAAIFSVCLTRVLPLRLRPVFEPSLSSAFSMPHIAPDWARVSSLPSDHAALFIALACGLTFVSRRWGLLLLLHALLFVLLPRAFIGLHYFWDLVAGALIGVVFAWLGSSDVVRTRVSAPLVRFEASHAPAFYGVMFALTMQIGELFHGSREVLGLLSRAGGALVHSIRVGPDHKAVLELLMLFVAVGCAALVLRHRRRVG